MKYDIYKILRHHNKAPKILREMEDTKITLGQILANAADEIENLRGQIKELKKRLKKHEQFSKH